MGEVTKWHCLMALIIFLGLTLLVSAIAWPMAWREATVQTEAMKQGYEQVPLPGTTGGTYWKKTKNGIEKE